MSNYLTCQSCGASLDQDDRAIYKKLVNRGAEEFLCVDCLAKYLDVPPKEIRERIRYYRESGTCVLFR